MNWIDTLRGKIAELELIASWASQTGFGDVRDQCRIAAARLQREVSRLQTDFERADGRRLDTTF